MEHPKYGASWQGVAPEQVLSLIQPREAYFWTTHAGAELDLFVPQGPSRFGFEMKCADAPTVTKSMNVAIEALRLRRLFVVYPGTQSYRLAPTIEVVAIADLPAALG